MGLFLFSDFAVQGFDLMIRYKGQSYYFMVDEDCVWLSDENFTVAIKKFANGNDVLENFCIENVPLYKLVDKLEDYEPMLQLQPKRLIFYTSHILRKHRIMGFLISKLSSVFLLFIKVLPLMNLAMYLTQ